MLAKVTINVICAKGLLIFGTYHLMLKDVDEDGSLL